MRAEVMPQRGDILEGARGSSIFFLVLALPSYSRRRVPILWESAQPVSRAKPTTIKR